MSATKIVRVADENAVIATLGQHIAAAAAEAIAERGVFCVGLSGGSLVNYLAKLAADLPATEWSKWQLFFCDERYVPESDGDSTFGQYSDAFIPKTGLRPEQFLRLDSSLELKDCAHTYEQEIYRRFGIQDVSLAIQMGYHYSILTYCCIFFSLCLHRHSWTSKPFRNSICFCSAWDRTVTRVRCFPATRCCPRTRC